MKYDITKKYNLRVDSSYSVFPYLIMSIFKKGKEDKSGGTGKGTVNKPQQVQANELKFIIQEMIAELESQKPATKITEGSAGTFEGRAKDITEFETLIEARRQQIDTRLRKIGILEDHPGFDTPLHELPGSELEPFEKPDEIRKRIHYRQQQYPKHEALNFQDAEVVLPKQPKLKPTEESIIEFDESKYFHEHKHKPVKMDDEIEDWDEDKTFRPEEKLKSKKRKKKSRNDTETMDIHFARKKLVQKRKALTKTYLNELNMLNELMGIMESVKDGSKPGAVDTVMSKLEEIVKDYKTIKTKKTNKIKDNLDDFDDLEELEELEELEDMDDAEVWEKLEELEELEELDEADASDNLEQLEELEVLGEVDDSEDIEELEPLDDLEINFQKKSKKKAKTKKLDNNEDLDDLEELEEVD